MPDVIQLSRSSRQDMTFWKKFEGQLLDGQFPLDGYLALSSTGATFLGHLGGQENPVLIKIVRYGSAGWEQLSASWALAKQLQHPNLVRVHATGLGSLDGLRVSYAVTDLPETTLTDVLRERCLTAEEGRELLLNCSEALQYLHQKGVVHTQVQPAGVVAVNEVIKLSSDHLLKSGERDGAGADSGPYAAPEVASEGYTSASDIWSLGIMMIQALTGSLPETAGQAPASDPQTAYSDVVRRCLIVKPASRATARQILSALKHSSPERIQAAKGEVAPPLANGLPKPRPTAEQPPQPNRMVVLKYAIPILGVLLLGFFYRASTAGYQASPPSPASAPSTKPPLPKPADQGDVDRSKDKPSPVVSASPAQEPVVPAAPRIVSPSPSRAPGAQTWLVIVYTYSHADTAQHKAAEINRRWPDMQAHVLANGSSHLVALGSGLDRAGAARLRQRVLAVNLPRDSYIQNF